MNVDQKHVIIEASRLAFARLEKDADLLTRVVSIDKIWVHIYDL